MSLFKRVVRPAIVAPAWCVATVLTMAIASDLATADDTPTDPLRQDWLHQADGQPTSWRIRREITWTREVANRLTATGNGPDLSAELKELDALERRLPGSDPARPKPKTTPTQLLPRGLVARWAFDQTENGQILDASGSDARATIRGASEVAQGVGGDSLRLGGGGHVETSLTAASVAEKSYTVAAWVRTTAGVVDVLGSGVGSGNLLIVINQGPVRAHHYTDSDGNVLDGKARVNDGRWHHLAQVVDDKTISIYVDGKLDVSAPLRGTKTGSAAPLCLGTRSPGSATYRYQGCLDEVCMFDRALTADEMQTIHALGKKLIGADAADKDDVDLYLAVRRVKRRIMMKDPLLDFSKVVLVDVPCYDALNHESMHRVFPQAQNNVGRLLTLEGLHPEGKVTDLTGQTGMFWRPDVSFDGKKVLFCMRPEGERTFHLYEKDLDVTPSNNSQIRQITNAKYDDLDPIYMPDGHISFLSNRGNSYARCAVAHPSYVVSRCDADGKNLYILSMGTEPEYTPTLLPDGRVMYTRWEYTDKELFRIQSLWTMNPDGTNVATLWGNQSYWPDMLVEARPIPGSRRIIFSGQGHHDIVHGSIGMIDPTEGFNYPDGLTRVTTDRPWAEVGNGPADKVEKEDYHAAGRFDGYRCPYPLSETLFLVSAKLPQSGDPAGVGSAKTNGGRFALYLMDVWGNRELIYAGRHDVLYAMPVRPRPVPRAIQDRTAWPGLAGQGEEAEPGVLYSNDVFEGLPDELREKAKYVRVIHQDYTTFTFGLKCQMPDHNGVKGQHGDQHAGPPLTIASNDGIKRILGTVPIESDGSFAVEVPPCKAIHFQLLDDRYRAVHIMRSFTGVMPGEKRGCVGCHESQGTAPATTHSLALAAGPVRPTPPPWGSKYHLGYRQDVQPILDRHCAKCHQGEGKGREKLDMTFRPSADGGSYTEPYLTLTLGPKRHISRFAVTLSGGGVAGTLLPMATGFTPEHDVTLPPMSAMSYKSKLVANATSGKHHDVRVDSLSARKLIAWVDLLCPYWNEDDIRSTPDPDPTDPYFANSAYPPRTPGVKPFADSPYPPRMKNAPIVHRAYRQDHFSTQQDRLRAVTAVREE
ncbi:MAG: hypothetical protein HQ567_02800 [Candidatus Nealsonbacteria bacterium]|nr:hypothetical protein [Candidatus Nealsonbacteria bacterium]